MDIVNLVVNPIVSKVSELLVDPAVRQVKYVFSYTSNIHNLQQQLQKLTHAKQRVLHSVEVATRNPLEQIESDVQYWLAQVDAVTQQADQILLQHEDREKRRCFMGLCPNFIKRHQISRKASKEIAIVVEAREGGNFDTVSYRIPPQGIGESKDFEAFESRTSIVDEILRALKDADVNLIGVSGIGGVGKTTLVNQIAMQVREHRIFKLVVMATVTHNPVLKDIQQEIADWLDFQLDVESVAVRAARLSERIKKEKKILIILDDIWVAIKLDEVGIPYGTEHKGINILMTSRNQSVLLEMGVQRDFRLEVLEHQEAWNLFEKKAGDVKDSNLRPIAMEVAERCAGLPILIVAVATALKNKQSFEWKDALQRLQKFDGKGYEKRVYSALELSFNFLGDDEKSLFRFLGQLRAIEHIEDLVKYVVGLGLFNQLLTLEATRNRLLKVISDLKLSCLLLEDDDHERIKMHEVVHNFAASFASKHDPILIATNETELDEWPNEDFFEQCTSISLQLCKIPELPEVFECPKLKFFLLLSQDSSLKVPENLFSRMKELKVLDLTGIYLSPLPSSLQYLDTLQTLCLCSCDLEDIAVIGELKQLRVLSLLGSSIVRLPSEVRKLTRLRVLDLSKCQGLEVIPPDVLSRLVQLEELYMGGSFVQWEGEGHDAPIKNANLSELKLLSKLSALEIHILDANIMPKNLFSKKLESFRVFIGDEWDWPCEFGTSRMLKLKLNRSALLERVKVLLMKTEDLYLEDLKGVKSILYELDDQGFLGLKHLHVQNCLDIQYVIDWMIMNHLIAFPRLESLFLDNLNRLEKICRGTSTLGSFSNLKKFKVGNCNVLRSLFTFSMFKDLKNLEEVNVSNCKLMEVIIVGEGEDDEEINFTQIRSLTLENLPQFTSFCSQKMKEAIANSASNEIVCEGEGEASLLVFSKKIQFPNLEYMRLFAINVEMIWPHQHRELSPSIEKLTTLIVDGCGNLSFLFTSSILGNLAQLKVLEICDCKSMEEVIISEGGGVMSKVLLPKLHNLKLKGLPKLVRFCIANLIECPSLKVLRMENCTHLQAFVSTQVNETIFDEKVLFPNLEELHVEDMHNFEVIWCNELLVDSFSRLKVLEVLNGKRLLKIFPSKLLKKFLVNLESLVVRNCGSIEEVFDLREIIQVREEHVVDCSQLRYLDMRNLPRLIQVWNRDPHDIISFYNIREVYAWDCPNLKKFFPFSVAQCLPHLELLNIDGCGMEELIAKGGKPEAVDVNTKFVFHGLKTMVLWRLEELKCFYSGKHTLECPELKILTVFHCEKLRTFDSEYQEMQDAATDKQQNKLGIKVLPPLFSFREVMGNLEELALNNLDIAMIQKTRFRIDHFVKLKVLHLQSFYDSSTYLPLNLLQKFPNLEKLVLRKCYFTDLLLHGDAGEDAGVLSQIRFLKLDVVPNIRHIWNQDCPFLQNLETLEIWSCNGLTNLIPSSATFQNLTTLDVQRCQGISSLLSSSTARNMVNLTKMTVKESNMVKEIVSGSDTNDLQSQNEIILGKLTTLRLHFLERLESFCPSALCNLKFPSLEDVIVTQCPKMKVFSRGPISTPKLKRVNLTEERDKGCWVGDLNSSIKQLYADKVGFSGMQHLKLSEFPELEEVWQHQLPINFFYNLNSLEVDEVAFMSIAVPSHLLPILNDLEKLEVRNCNSIEQVFGLESPNFDGRVGNLFNLSELNLINLPTLRRVWIEVPKGILDLRNLKLLKIHNCSSLRNIFTATICFGLEQLQVLEVISCAMVEEIITEDSMNEIKFPLLNSITLESLPNLIKFNSGSGTVHCPSLKQISVAECPQMRTLVSNYASSNNEHEVISSVLFDEKVQFSSLVDMKLSGIDVEMIWPYQYKELSPHIEKLTTLIVDGFVNLNFLFTSSIVGSLVQLKVLEICDCKSMEEVIIAAGEEIMSQILFPNLHSLKLKGLPKLVRFSAANLIHCPSLELLQMENCPQLQAFLSTSISKNVGTCNEATQVRATLFNEKVWFPNLEKLYVKDVHKLEMIWCDEVLVDSFCRLKVVEVINGRQLMKIFPSKLLKQFLLNLESLVVKNCGYVEEVFDLQEVIQARDADCCELRILVIRNLPRLTEIWNRDPHEILSFCNLREVYACDCPNLKRFFPFSIAQCLPHLELLSIVNCGMEELVEKEESAETIAVNTKFVFGALKTIFLWRLRELKCFYSGKHTLRCPQLKSLMVYLCEKVKTFSSESQEMQEKELKIQVQPSLFSFREIIGNLEELALNSQDVAIIQQTQFSADLFVKLKVLCLQCFYDSSQNLPFNLLQKFPNLEKLALEYCFFRELAPHGDVGEDTHMPLSQIRFLTLDFVPNIKHIWNQDCPFLQNLETLRIWECNGLTNLAPSSTAFQNLTTLDVGRCHGLSSLLYSSTANSMVNLTTMMVRESNMVKEIVSSDINDFQSQNELFLGKLTTLILVCLKSLESFCSSALCTLKFPSLEDLIVTQCPKMKMFSQGPTSTPKLFKLSLTEERDKWRWVGDLNFTIKQLYADKVGFSGLQHLKLSEFPELEELWQHQLPVNFFSNLSSLEVDEVAFSSVAVPSNLLAILNDLEQLEIRNCDSVEQVFESLERPNFDGRFGNLYKLNELKLINLPTLRRVWIETPKGILDLGNLKLLKIYNCSSLRYIFTATICSALEQLQVLEVKSCAMVEEIITGESVNEIKFPLLHSITLESLPSLIKFNSGSNAVHCPSLKEITVADCLTTFTCSFLLDPNATEPKVIFPSLEELKLSSTNIEMRCHAQQLKMSSYAKNLTGLTVDGCGDLKYLISSSSTVHLKRLEICNCKMMEQVMLMEEETMSRMLLHQLEYLKLKDLLELQHFCTSNLVECAALKELSIQNCPKMRTFASNSANSNNELETALFDEKVAFPNLEQLQILNMDNLKMIWLNQLHADSFCKVKVFTVKHCKELVKIFPSVLLEGLQNLQDLVISNCDSLEEIFYLQELIQMKEPVAIPLTNLNIENLPNLKHVWNEDPLRLVLFDNISSVVIWNCPNLEIIFPASIAKNLLQLETLNVSRCDRMEAIVAQEQGTEATIKFIFPCLKMLLLRELNELKCFYPGIHTIESPLLERLIAWHCDKLNILCYEYENWLAIDRDTESQPMVQVLQPLFSFRKIIPNLEILTVTRKDATMICQSQIPEDLFQKLKTIMICCFHDESVDFPFGVLERFRYMEILGVGWSQFKELFPYEGFVGRKEYVEILRRIQHLQLNDLSELTNIWNQHSQLDQLLQSLKTLKVWTCNSLVTLAPSSAAFQNLTTLDVLKCNGLVSLVSSSTAKSLEQLESMSIKECDGLKEIVANDGDEIELENDIIIFRKLESLELGSLPSLICFCSSKRSLKFPSLTKVTMKQCPKMQVFSKGVLSTSSLLGVQKDDQWHWNGKLNAAIQQFFA